MKKIISAIVCLFISSFVFSEASKIIGFDIGLSTGLPVYSDSGISDANDRVNDGDFNRVIIGSVADVSFHVCEPLKLLVGGDLLCDLIWSGNSHSNHIDYAGWFGVKAYPGFGGLNGSVCYAVGCRTDFINNDVEDTVVHNASWGNGFRLGIEYDFLYGTERSCMPCVGFYYRYMPRGESNYDNIFSVYATLSF